MTQSFYDWRRSLLLCLLAFALASCGGGEGGGGGVPDPEPTPDPKPGETTGQVTFAPNWGDVSAPSALRFHFYPATGAAITKECDATGFSGTLEHGTYRMLAYNTDATGVTFAGTDSYATAAVRVNPAEAPTRASSSVLMQPGKVYALIVDNLIVEKGGTISQTPTMKNLVRPLALNFIIDDGSVVSSIRGFVNGFYPAVLLSTGRPDDASAAASKDAGFLFDVSLSGDAGSASLHSLGVLNPWDGAAYRCMLVLDITVKDGRSTQTEVDLSEVLTKILAENGGVLPGVTPAKIKIKLEMLSGSVMGFKGIVADWQPGEDVGGDL